MANQWHSKSSEEVLSELNVTIKGLTTQQVQNAYPIMDQTSSKKKKANHL